MSKNINQEVEKYQKIIREYSMSTTYKFLLAYMNKLQKEFNNELSHIFSVNKVLNGYLDYTYFYFTNEFLKDRKLKLAIVYNHQENCFNLWLLGTIKQSQINYWNKFKNTEWNNEESMSPWYVLSVDLISKPNFLEIEKLTELIIEESLEVYFKLRSDL